MLSFIENFRDFAKIDESLQSKVKEIAGRKVIFEEVKVNAFVSKNSKPHRPNPYKPANAAVDVDRRKEPLPPRDADAGSSYAPRTGGLEVLVLGNSTQEERDLKKILIASAKDGFVKIKQEQEKQMNELQLVIREIKFNLNLITLENFGAIKTVLTKYATEKEEFCGQLISLMIEKAWIEPKFAPIYAKLSRELALIKEFQYEIKTGSEKGEGKTNPFKHILIQQVQNVFEDHRKEEGREELSLKDKKKKIIGNIRFIGELIIVKVLSKKIPFICIGMLLEHFLVQHNAGSPEGKEVAEIYFEAVIELIEKIGDLIEVNEEKREAEGAKVLEEVVAELREKKKVLPSHNWSQISCNKLFDLFDKLEEQILEKQYPRIIALLKNLVERRRNQWKQHLVTSTDKGPQTLKDINSTEQESSQTHQREEKRAREAAFDFDSAWKDTIARFEKGEFEKEEAEKPVPYGPEELKADANRIFKFDKVEALHAFLRVVADGTKDAIRKRLDLFRILLDAGIVKTDNLRKAWELSFNKLAYADMPYGPAAIGKLFALTFSCQKLVPADFYMKGEEEEEQEYIDEVFWKFYTYEGNERQDIRSLIKLETPFASVL